jgi:hypothetical protein
MARVSAPLIMGSAWHLLNHGSVPETMGLCSGARSVSASDRDQNGEQIM